MKWPDFKKRIKKGKTTAPNIVVVCKNCETQFSGNFCPECGQSVSDYDKPFSFIFYNFIGDFFAFDTRFFKTFAALLIKPGFLSKEYFDGKRVKYAPPFRIFVFASFVLFFLLQISSNKGLNKVLDSSVESLEKIPIDSSSTTFANNYLADINTDLDSAKTNDLIIIDRDIFNGDLNIRESLEKLALTLENILEEETDEKEKAELREYIRLCRSPEMAIAKILEYMSWAFFLLLPIFALILKLAYIRRKQNYIRHLVFSIHIHSFIFLILIIIIGLNMIINGSFDVLSLSLFILIPVYLSIALKKFYGQTLWKVISKFIFVSFLYNFVFWIISGIVILNAFSII